MKKKKQAKRAFNFPQWKQNVSGGVAAGGGDAPDCICDDFCLCGYFQLFSLFPANKLTPSHFINQPCTYRTHIVNKKT